MHQVHSPGTIASCLAPISFIRRSFVDGKSIKHTIEATSAPTTCATMNAGTWFMAMPAKVVVKPRASATAGLANDVDEVNQYAAVIARPTSHGIAWGA